MGAGAGFDLLAQGNVQRRQMDYEQKLADRDFLFKTNFDKLLTNEGNLQNKLAASLDKNGKPIDPEVTEGIRNEITQNEGAQRQLYDEHLHPARNPGALQRLGGWIAGRLHITHPAPSVTTEVGAITIPGTSPSSAGPAVTLPGHKLTVTTLPQKQYDKQQALQAKNLAADREAAQQAAAGAPIGPLQEEAMKTQGALDLWRSRINEAFKTIKADDPEMSDGDAMREAFATVGVRIDESLGAPVMLQLASGEKMAVRYDKQGRAFDLADNPVDPSVLAGATLAAKPGSTSHTILNQEQDAYAKSYGFKDFSQVPPALQSDVQLFVQQRAKLNTEFGHATRSTTTKPDATGQLRAVTVWNYTTPFGVKPLEDPLSGLYKLGANKPTLSGQGTAQPPTTPTKKESTAPRKQAHGEPGRQGNVQISAPLGMQMQTSVLTKAANDYTAAEKIDQMAKHTLAAPDNTVQQRNLALSLIKAMAGRVQMTEYNLYTTRMGVPNTVEGLVNGITKSGQLPGNIVKDLADTAASDLYAARYVLQNTPGGQDWLNAQKGGEAPTAQTGGFKWDDDNAPIHKGGR